MFESISDNGTLTHLGAGDMSEHHREMWLPVYSGMVVLASIREPRKPLLYYVASGEANQEVVINDRGFD